MIVKPAIAWLTTDSDPLLINNITVILAAITANVDIYKTPSPPLADVQTALDNLSDAVVKAADGGPSATSHKNNLRLILVGLMRQLANYVGSACNGDMTNLLLSGFPVQKPTRHNVGPLPTPGNLTLTLAEQSGKLAARANPVFGAALYTWRLKNGAPGAPVITTQTTAARTTFSGLTPGATYTLEVNAVGTAGPSDWSGPVSQMVV